MCGVANCVLCRRDGDLPILLPQHDTVTPCFSTYFSSLNPNKATELTEEPPPVHSKWNIQSNAAICSYFMFVTWTWSTVNLKLIDNLIVSPDTSTQPTASRAEWLYYRIGKLLDCSSGWQYACYQWRNNHCRMSPHGFLIRAHKFRTGNKTRPSGRACVVTWSQELCWR
jgi:hypothetical protein